MKSFDANYNTNVQPSLLIVTYNVEDAGRPTRLYFYHAGILGDKDPSVLGVDMFDKVEIDGTEVSVASLDSNSGKYQLSSGEHTIAYTLKDPTFIGVEYDEQTGMPTKIGATFIGCCGITSVIIPDSVTSIGSDAFYNCSNLTSVTIPNGVTSIGRYVFRYCTNLASVTIPDSVTSIGEYTFDGCIFASITIPGNVAYVGSGAFMNYKN